MTCKDCIYEPVCIIRIQWGVGTEWWDNHYISNIETRCKSFTPKEVAIVRCGECKHFHEYPYIGTNYGSGWGKCKKISMDIDLTINDFCSYGERKEGTEK